MCVKDSDDLKKPTRSVQIVIQVIIFFSVILFAVSLIVYGVTPYAAGIFVPIVVAAAIKAGRDFFGRDEPDDGAMAASRAS